MISYNDIEAAAERIAPFARMTPLLTHQALDAETGAKVFVKAESLQHFGAFKIRGAFNRLAAMSAQERAKGVLAFSSGNHAIAVAAASKHFGMRATIVMPADAPKAKLDTTRGLGAEVVTYDRAGESREAIGARIADKGGMIIVPPFNDPFIAAGQGTVGREIVAEIAPDIVIAPASGGGLVGGTAIAVHHAYPNAKVYAAEPQGHDDIVRSLASGRIEKNPPGIRSFCDALMVDQMGDVTWEIAQKHLAGAVAVSDEEVRDAMRFAFRYLKLVLEPSGAIALAALLSRKIEARGKSVAIVASGGNVDPALFAEVLQAGPEAAPL
ncbi:MAG: threonine/serine dehydratase [Hyphomonadaceae bacterium]|nr:threonine/serine dehydratase [Hyphomonadaceae bacterium]